MAIVDTLIGNVKGKKGDAGEITAVTASVANNVGTPSCAVTLGGTPSERTINLAFSGLKGAKGDTGSVTTGGTTGDFDVAGDLNVNGTIIGLDGTIDNLNVEDIIISNKIPFVRYYDCSTATLTTGANVTGLNYNKIKAFIDNGGCPMLSLQVGANPSRWIFRLNQILTQINNLQFYASIPTASASGTTAEHMYITIDNANYATLIRTNI